jgi:hypothetical protein
MKNRKREICTSGSVRDENGKHPHLLGRRQFLHLASGAAALPIVSQFAWAQAYPTRPVHLIVGTPAGLAPDIIARLMVNGCRSGLASNSSSTTGLVQGPISRQRR